MDGNNVDGLEDLVLQLATIVERLDRRSEQAVDRVDASAAGLDQGLYALHRDTQRFVDAVTHALGTEARHVMTAAAGSAFTAFNQQLLDSVGAVRMTTRVLEEQGRRLVSARRMLVWNAMGALLVGSTLAIGVATYTGWRAMQRIHAAQFSTDVLRATQSGALTRCGGELCAKVGGQIRHYGKNPDYVLLAQ